MRILLDTHVWLWWLTAPERLNAEVTALLVDPNTPVFISAAVVWEIVIKVRLGKLTLPGAPDTFLPQAVAEDGMTGLPIEHAHVLRVGHLPPHHRDPFDRLLVAQAHVEKLHIVTADTLLTNYDAPIVWAV